MQNDFSAILNRNRKKLSKSLGNLEHVKFICANKVLGGF